MEKVTVKIGMVSPHSSQRKPKVRDIEKDIKFIQEAFDISYMRAKSIVNVLWHPTDNMSTQLTVDLTYEQLGKYTAMRMAEKLQYYFKFPYVIGLVKCVPKPKEPEQLIFELRPGKRTIP